VPAATEVARLTVKTELLELPIVSCTLPGLKLAVIPADVGETEAVSTTLPKNPKLLSVNVEEPNAEPHTIGASCAPVIVNPGLTVTVRKAEWDNVPKLPVIVRT